MQHDYDTIDLAAIKAKEVRAVRTAGAIAVAVTLAFVAPALLNVLALLNALGVS